MTPLEKAVSDIRNFKVQGANQIAIFGLKFLRGYAKQHGFGLKFEAAAHFLEEARPTAVVLHNCIEIVKKKKTVGSIDSVLKSLQSLHEKEAKQADKIVKDGSVILTYCHSGEAMSFIKHIAVKHKKRISVIACETEPLEQGIRTVKEMVAAKIPVTLIGDNAVNFFMPYVDMVVVGSDAMRREGSVNKIGTSLVALSAAANRKPLYVVASTYKMDRRASVKIEERSWREIYRKILDKKDVRGVKIRNPAFDVTPWKNVTAVVTESGVMSPAALTKMIGR
ncbi:MAG: translation initiation factor eIF-2B [Candidatus Aenigmarchaeota archaeon]|nr:translation initiation factor eIF-2B [Candidatus Aenigmarchaeota archaeon]